MISVVCVYNNKKVFEEYLLKSLAGQTAAHELIALDNSSGRYASAAQALNDGARRAGEDISCFVFVHQDILLTDPDFLAFAEKTIGAVPDMGIAGIAGNAAGEKKLYANITHGTPPRDAGRKFDMPVRAMTVDECCVVIPRHAFDRFRFDETVCDGWHLYAVEYCLRIQKAGLSPYILPAALHHASTGIQGRAYFRALKKVLRRHRTAYTKIYTTCGCWHTRMPAELQMGWFFIKEGFYAVTNRLVAWGAVPLWLQRKKQRRLQGDRNQYNRT